MLVDFRKIIAFEYSVALHVCPVEKSSMYVDEYEYRALVEWFGQEQTDLKIITYLNYSLLKDSFSTAQ
jgi:hypothetical protein